MSPATFEWTPPANPNGQLVAIAAAAVEPARNVSGLLLCVATADAGRFEVPGWATANIPASAPGLWETNALLSVGAAPPPAAGLLDLPGVDLSLGRFISWSAATARVEKPAQ